jgi:hypothetical protein
MGQSVRLRTGIGVDQKINVELQQDFEFLEILSLKIQQADVYNRNCANYGVVVGRVTANNGLGIPNARISVFVPIDQADQSNSVITSIYPYKNPLDINEDGYRYNLLPYTKSYSKHAATGTFPSINDVIADNTAMTIFDKYYQFTVKTNDSGDYMIMGVPLGSQTLVMDLDLSDIGEFSLTPQDLIRMGIATESQVSGDRFKTSSDLNSLPQIVSITKSLEVSPLWGDPDVCQIAINRVDFDLREDANVDIQPTSVFIGSIYSSSDKYRIKRNCKPRDNTGNLCDLQSSPGQILAIRQTIRQDSNGNPILEVYDIEQSGNVIDGDGAWVIEVPMNLDYITTNEFGERVISTNTSIGVPTSAKYRFKIKWQQPNDLTIQTRRAYYLVPNVREYGWNLGVDPNYQPEDTTIYRQMKSSYYFGLDWSGYTDGFSFTESQQRLSEIINGDDSFYEFKYNKVYTVSGLIDQYKNGFDRGKFIGIKEIDDDECSSTVNKFPVNDGVRNFDLLFFLFSIVFQVIQLLGSPLLLIFHLVAFIWNTLVKIGSFFSAFFFAIAIYKFIQGTSLAVLIVSGVAAAALITEGVYWTIAGLGWLAIFLFLKPRKFNRVKLPSISYPNCQACDCNGETTSSDIDGNPITLLSPVSNSGLYYENLLASSTVTSLVVEDDQQVFSMIFSEAIGTTSYNSNSNMTYRVMESQELRSPSNNNKIFAYSNYLPLGERINIFNLRKKYFDGVNKISVTFDYPSNIGKNHYDNTLSLLFQDYLEAGTLLTFVNPTKTKDVNYLYSGDTNGKYITGISGTPLNAGSSTYSVKYADTQVTEQVVTYFLNTGTTIDNYKFPLDQEYYQVLTAITINQAKLIWSNSNVSSLPYLLQSGSIIYWNERTSALAGWGSIKQRPMVSFEDMYMDYGSQYVVILQRGVDPYSPLYTNTYGLGKIFGLNNESDITITANTRINIPIQKLSPGGISVQTFSDQSNIYYPSHFFNAGDGYSAFTSDRVGYYSSLDANNNSFNGTNDINYDSVVGVISDTANAAYDIFSNPGKYDSSEDLSGGAFYYVNNGNKPADVSVYYDTKVLLPQLSASPMNFYSKVNNVMRTDRLPSSDYLDGSSWANNPSLLQQNIGFAVYVINALDEDISVIGYSTGANMSDIDTEGQVANTKVLESFECENLVGLTCYTGNSVTFGIDQTCVKNDEIENGCYIFMERPLRDLSKDIKNFAEWGYRFRFFYGLCRGVLSQVFTNNWVNGSLYAFPIQVDTKYDKQNKPSSSFCKDLIFFDKDTNNFYYRSSPFNYNTEKFVGKTTIGLTDPLNSRNLLYPTTIVNLGFKDNFYSEIILDPSANGYVMDKIDSTSYGDTSDLVNLFVISRITNQRFISQITSGINPNNSLDKLFSRDEKRVDGDIAQLMSINSEIGVVKFSPQYYESDGVLPDPVVILNPSANNVVVGVFFSSTTDNLQTKDYITPGRIDFRPNNNDKALGFQYGIKSQRVPFYQWGLNQSNTIFGDELNTWKTTTDDIFSREIQSLDRTGTTIPSYFLGSNTQINDTYARGYIFNVDPSGNNSANYGNYNSKFLVGAPFHFYFGIYVGKSALDKFKTKYSVND